MKPRRLIMALAGLNALLMAALLAQAQRVAPAGPETVRATAFELVDERGRVRAQLNVESSGEAVLRLRDAKGDVRVKLGASEDGSGLLLLDGSTEPAVHLLAKPGGPSLTLTSRDGRRRAIAPDGRVLSWRSPEPAVHDSRPTLSIRAAPRSTTSTSGA